MKTAKVSLSFAIYAGLFWAGMQAASQSTSPGDRQHVDRNICFSNGQWFDGTGFRRGTLCSVHGIFSSAKNIHVDQVIDLHGQFAVPPYGDAHEHNFDNLKRTPAVVAQYLHDGIFYAQGMTDLLSGANAVRAAGLVNSPESVEVTYAHGGLTGIDGHPKEVYESIANGFYYPSTPEQKQLVRNSHGRAGEAYWEIDSPSDLVAQWPKILATKPDLIKVYLSESEHYTAESHLHPELGKGIDPALVALITARAHAAGLKVAAHVDTATDYHLALLGNVDEMGHLPGYGIQATSDLQTFRLSDADIALTAQKHVRVQATAGIDVDDRTLPADLKSRRTSQVDNLTRLKAAGVVILVGSDHYGEDSVHEADYLHTLGVWTNSELLRMWAVTTPQTIFPTRKIGELKEEYEASFLVLSADPIKDWQAAHAIVDRWKQGRRVGLNAATLP